MRLMAQSLLKSLELSVAYHSQSQSDAGPKYRGTRHSTADLAFQGGRGDEGERLAAQAVVTAPDPQHAGEPLTSEEPSVEPYCRIF